MDLSRRALLGAGGVAVGAGLAGCTAGEPMPWTRVELAVREAFDADSSVLVPLSVDVALQNTDGPAVALRDLAVACYDADRERLATHELGDFARQSAPDERRSTETVEGTWTSTTAYRANWTLEPDLAVDAVPTWITVQLSAVEFGPAADGDDGSATAATRRLLPVGRARASQPAPEFAVEFPHLPDSPQPGERVRPADFERHRLAFTSAEGRELGVEEPLLPDPPPDGSR